MTVLEQSNPKAAAADAPQAIIATERERRQGRYGARNLQRALGALHQDGLVVLRGVVDVAHVDALNEAMCAEAERIAAGPGKVYNHGVRSNFLQRPPVDQPAHLHEDIYFNRFLLQVANAYLGHKPIWNWLTANTALPHTGGLRQPAHKDSAFEHPAYPYYFIANVPLCDFSAANGSTEFWLGSHAHTSAAAHQEVAREPAQLNDYITAVGDPMPFITAAAKEARLRGEGARPPVQPVVRRGDVMVRDLRLWHAGMPNESDAHRIMLGLGYMSPTHPNYDMRLHLPQSQQGFFLSRAADMVEVRANFYPDEELAKIRPDEHFDLRPSYEETD